MKPTSLMFAGLLSSVCLLCSGASYAWGPEAHKSIVQSAYQILQYHDYNMIRVPDGISYERDLVRGAMDGRAIIGDNLPIHSDEQAVDAIEYEIQLLRAAREHGVGSYFAYRLGTLASLIADVMHPYGIGYTPEQERLKEMIDVDIEESIHDLDVNITKRKNDYIISMDRYLNKNRPLYKDDQLLIQDEYKRGINFGGYAGRATPYYYERSVEAIIDVWNTIISPQSDSRALKPSDRAKTWYFVNEIGYLLEVRKNINYANRAYEVYESVNPGILETHLALGDKYYAFDSRESRVKGVEEWIKVQQAPGEFRVTASVRLSQHYIREGDSFVAHAQSPDAVESDLSEALHSFTMALQFDQTNVLAAEKINNTSVVIEERRDEYNLQQKYIDSGILVIQEAEKARLNKDYGTALALYSQALNLLQLIDEQFRDLQETAVETISRIRKDMKGTTREVINSGNAALEVADTAQLNENFDEAIRNYNAAISIVSVIRPAPGSIDEQSVNSVIEAAEIGISDTESAKNRAEKNKALRVNTPL